MSSFLLYPLALRNCDFFHGGLDHRRPGGIDSGDGLLAEFWRRKREFDVGRRTFEVIPGAVLHARPNLPKEVRRSSSP